MAYAVWSLGAMLVCLRVSVQAHRLCCAAAVGLGWDECVLWCWSMCPGGSWVLGVCLMTVSGKAHPLAAGICCELCGLVVGGEGVGRWWWSLNRAHG